MARYWLTLLAFTPEALANLTKNPQDRAAATREMLEAAGGKLHAYFHSSGEYHAAVIAEVPDDNPALAWTIESVGHLKTYKLIPLYSVEETLEALRAGDIAWQGPSGGEDGSS